MALTIVVEDGAGRSDANAYISRADADAYFEGRPNAAAWTGATTGEKEMALVMATRVVDAMFRFHGYKVNQSQALLWPRMECPDVESSVRQVPGIRVAGVAYLPSDSVPACVRDGTCEVARELLIEDRTGDPEGVGMRSMGVDGVFKMVFDPLRPKPIVPRLAQAMLRRVGFHLGGRGASVPIVRG